MGMPSLQTPTDPRCSERGCPFPSAPGETLCRQHVEMFAADESLYAPSIEATEEDVSSAIFYDESISVKMRGMVPFDEWLENAEGKKQVARARIAFLSRQRRASGLCFCGRALDIPNRRTCRFCTEGRLERGKQRRKLLLASGLCLSCGKVPVSGHRLCKSCSLRARGYDRRRRPKKRLPAKHTESGRLLSALLASRRRFKEWRDSGLCTHCGNPTDGLLKRCRRCRAIMEDSRRRRRHRRISLGLCPMCGKNRPNPGRKWCVKCVRRWRQFRKKRVSAA